MSASPEHGGSAEPCEAIGACLRTQVRIFFHTYFCSYLSAHTYYLFLRFYSHLPLSSANAATFPVSGDGLRVSFFPYFPSRRDSLHFLFFPYFPSRGDGLRFVFFPFISKQWKRNFYVRHFFIFRFVSLIFFDFYRSEKSDLFLSCGYFFSFGP